MNVIGWDRYPLLSQRPRARTWLQIQADLGLRPNTIAAYGRGLEEYLRFLNPRAIDVLAVTREHVALYVADLRVRHSLCSGRTRVLTPGVGLANATMQQRLTVVRLFYDYLIEEGPVMSIRWAAGATHRVQYAWIGWHTPPDPRASCVRQLKTGISFRYFYAWQACSRSLI